MARAETKGPEFVRYFGPVLDALRALGNSGTPSEVREQVAKDLKIDENKLTETVPSGQSRFDNRVNWARFYLTKEGLIDGSERGVWKLAERGRDTKLSQEQALEIFKRQHALLKSVDEAGDSGEVESRRAEPSAEEIDAPSQDIATGHREKSWPDPSQDESNGI